MDSKFEIFQSRYDAQWYFRLKARNGKTIAQSEGYKTRASAMKGISAVKKSGNAKTVYV